MDSGPVDAGPNTDAQYDDPTQPPSPYSERRQGQREAYFRTASPRRSGDRNGWTVNSHIKGDGSHESRGRQRNRHGEPVETPDHPTYYTVGATSDKANGHAFVKDESTANSRTKKIESEKRDVGVQRLYRFTLYETNARYWITGSDLAEKYFRLLRIDRTSPPGQMTLFEDETTYDRGQLHDVLSTIDEGNQSTGGLRMKCTFWGLLGFIRFTEDYYMLLIAKRQHAAMIGGHYVYQIDGTELVPLTTGS
ncbi:MAG: hypothetical protein Q9191_008578, partial [Dirinaria sp. TL-2023a]